MLRPAPRLSYRRETVRRALRWLLAVLYLLAGILHLVRPEPFIAITPPWVPEPATVVLVTGLCEIAGAIGLFMPRLRWWAGLMLALYALCVWPANIHHWLADVAVGGDRLGDAYHIPRQLLQPLVIWWALYAGRVINWPFGPQRREGRAA